jgi:hypothetical protein
MITLLTSELNRINQEMKIIFDEEYKRNKEYGDRNNFEEKNILRITNEQKTRR